MSASLIFILQFILKEKKVFFLGMLMTAGVSVGAWIGPRVIAQIIDQGIVPGNRDLMVKGVLLLIVAEALRILCSAASQVLYSVLGQNVIERIRVKMVSHMLSLPMNYYDRMTSGGMMTRVVNDASALSDFFQSGFVSVLGNCASLVAAFVGLFAIHFRLGLALLLIFVPFAILCVLFSNQLRSVYEETRNRLSSLNSMLADFLFGMRTIRALGISRKNHALLVNQVDGYAESQKRMVRTFALFHPTVTLGVGCLLLYLIGQGLPLVGNGELKVGEWVAALSYVVFMQQPLIEISDRWNFFLGGITSISRIREVLNEGAERTKGLVVPPFETISFKGLSFQYVGASKLALRDVNLTLNRGDWVGVFGESGSGKSTFLQMLYGFYDSTKGVILWNDLSYQELDLKMLRSHFGVVEQFPFLFAGSVRDNITLFGQFPFEEAALRATFQGQRLIESLLDHADFEIGERGSNLSMGQKQMITFLRAYLSKPEIWILDEATAFFDPEAELELLQSLEKLRSEGITVIQVAHRKEALNRMTRILQVAEGSLTELDPPSKWQD